MARDLNFPVLSECVADVEFASEIVRKSEAFATPADGVLFNEGDPPTCIYFVRRGEVTLTMMSASKEVMRVRAGPGSLLGLPAVVGNQLYTLTAKAEQGAAIFRLTSDAFNELMKSDPRMSSTVLRILAGEIRSARHALSDLVGGSSDL